MASLQNTLRNVGQQLGQMTPSQRVALLLGAVLIAGSLAWMVQWAATPELTPLLPQSLSSEEISQITAGLDELGQTYQVAGGKVLVPPSADRSSLLAQLQQSNQMPSDTSSGFAALVKESNPWLSQAESNRRWTVALQDELARVLGSFADVESASVFLNLTAARTGFSRNQPTNSASVTLTMRGGQPVPRQLAMSAARLVAGAVRGLPMHGVQVVDSSGRPAIEWEVETGDGGTSAIVRRQREEERERSSAIRQQLDYIAGLRVSVQVVLSHTTRQSNSNEVAEGASVQTRTHEETSGQRAATAQPGVQPNTGESVSAGAEGDYRTMTEQENLLQPSVTETKEVTPAGQIQEVFASIGIPHTYLAAMWKRANPDASAEPTDAQLEEAFVRLREGITRRVTKLVYPPRGEQIAVDWYFDSGEVAAAAPGAGAGAGAGGGPDSGELMAMAGRYGPAGLLGLLAVGALFMMLRMARQASSGEAFGLEIGLSKEALEAARRVQRDVATGSRKVEKQRVAEEAVAAIPMGAATEPMLEAQEVDEKMVQVNKMLEQVAQFVKQDEQGVAALVERWVDNR